MEYYKQRRIDVAPIRQANGTWHCPYMIIESRQTCWGCQTGCPNGTFSSRKEATTAALKEAKRMVDALEPCTLPRTRTRRLNVIH